MAFHTLFKVIVFVPMFMLAVMAKGKILASKLQASVNDLQYNVPLDSYDDIHLSWKLDYSKEKVTFRVRRSNPEPTGWFAFGMSDKGTLTSADLLLWWHTGEDHLDFTVR